jgi:hypothetical protein
LEMAISVMYTMRLAVGAYYGFQAKSVLGGASCCPPRSASAARRESRSPARPAGLHGCSITRPAWRSNSRRSPGLCALVT